MNISPGESARTPREGLETPPSPRRFTPALFFAIAGIVWIGLVLYLGIRFTVWNLLPGFVIIAYLFGVAWWFRARSRAAGTR